MTNTDHIDTEAMARLVKGHVTRAEAARLVLHLQACEECLFAFQKKYRWDAEDLWSRLLGHLKDFEPPTGRLRQASQQQHEADARAAKTALARLSEIAPEKQHLIVRNTRAFRSLPAVQGLLEEAREQWHHSPKLARHWAKLALIAVESLPVRSCPSPLVADYAARAWSYLGNAKRLLANFSSAEIAFETAAFWAERGTREPLELVSLWQLEHCLARDQRRFADAIDKGKQALSITCQAGAEALTAWSQIEIGITRLEANEYAAAVEWLEIPLRQAVHDLEVTRAAHHNLALALVECGRHDEARYNLNKARQLASSASHRLMNARFTWLDARIHARNERPEMAESLLRAVQSCFLTEGAHYPAALASLDLGQILLECGRPAEAQAQFEKAIPIFLERGVHREAREASVLLSRSFLPPE